MTAETFAWGKHDLAGLFVFTERNASQAVNIQS